MTLKRHTPPGGTPSRSSGRESALTGLSVFTPSLYATNPHSPHNGARVSRSSGRESALIDLSISTPSRNAANPHSPLNGARVSRSSGRESALTDPSVFTQSRYAANPHSLLNGARVSRSSGRESALTDLSISNPSRNTSALTLQRSCRAIAERRRVNAATLLPRRSGAKAGQRSRRAEVSERRRVNASRAFTLIEMLTVITIIAIIAGLAVPLLKNYGKSNVNVTASRQLLDDIGRARQLAMAQRTTVYMVFVPSNFWTLPSGINMFASGSGLTPTQQLAGSNLLDKQFTGYIDMAHGALGDQPGNHQWHYLTTWQSLPAGAFIPLWKFYNPNASPSQPYFSFTDPANPNYFFNIETFNYTNTFPFPTQDSVYPSSSTPPYLPYIAFNYLGQLSDYSGNLLSTSTTANKDQDFVGGGIDIPLDQGAVMPDIDPTTKALQAGNPQVVEQPIGNATNLTYNVVHIDPLTGRATLEYHKMQ